MDGAVLHMSKNKGPRSALLALAVFLLLTVPAVTDVLPEDGSITSPPEQSGRPTGPWQAGASIGSETLETRAEQGTDRGSQQQGRHAFQNEVAEAARANALPEDFFWRLIWQESRFRPNAISRAGAQGIAQFMPGTAAWRGLVDPFHPPEALHESARWLRELWGQFGNLGLAAAAYNAGPGRVSRWLAGRSSLPEETRDYVKIITGEPAERWADCAAEVGTECPLMRAGPPPPAVKKGSIAARFGPPRVAPLQGVAISDIDAGPAGPWGLQLAGDWSQARALAQFKKIQARFSGVLGDRRPVILRGQMAGRGSATWYRVRVAEATRERAMSLCARLEKAGGSCLVLRN
jgi:hypothetical protein